MGLKKNFGIGFLLFLFTLILVYAIETKFYVDLNMMGNDIYNVTWMNATNFNGTYYGDGQYLTGISTFNATYDAKQNDIGADCSAGNCVYGVNDDGTLDCRACAGGVGANYWKVTDGWMDPNTTAGGKVNINVTAINATTVYENSVSLTAKYLELTDSFGGDVSGTYDAIQVVNTQGLGWGNITSGWDLNIAWSNILGIGNVSNPSDCPANQYVYGKVTDSWSCRADLFNTSAEVQSAVNVSGDYYDIKVQDLVCTDCIGGPEIDESTLAAQASWYNTTDEIFAVVDNDTFHKFSQQITWGNISTGFNLDESWIGQLGFQNLTDYPSACSAGEAITQLGDTPVCSAFQTGTEVANTTEEMQDAAGALATGGTETLIDVSYDDAGNHYDFVVTNMVNTTDEIFTAVDNSTFHKFSEQITWGNLSTWDLNEVWSNTLGGGNITADSLTGTQIDESSLVVQSSWINTTEEMQDAVMDAIDGGTQTLITVTYQDATNDMDFVVDNDLHNYDWSNVVDADITDTLTCSIMNLGTSTFTGTLGGDNITDASIDESELAADSVKASELDVSDVSDDIAGDIAEGELADSIVITDDIKDDTISEADLDMTNTAADEDILTYESSAGGSFEWHTKAELGIGDMNDLVDDTSPQLGGYLDTNSQTIGSATDEIDAIYIKDNTKIYFGNDQDFCLLYNTTLAALVSTNNC